MAGYLVLHIGVRRGHGGAMGAAAAGGGAESTGGGAGGGGGARFGLLGGGGSFERKHVRCLDLSALAAYREKPKWYALNRVSVAPSTGAAALLPPEWRTLWNPLHGQDESPELGVREILVLASFRVLRMNEYEVSK
eukprot:GHVU01027060.1.p3 GENE.GHVU01027060.1~~GHVU01027060.1.p3  ORF type:complete len:136 (+),score=29.05 GHVU01027060.1:833-1240(+)